MKKRLVSMFLALTMCMGLAVPAAAISVQDTDERINELMLLAARAARTGNLELAQQYDNELQTLGVEVVTAEEVMNFQNNTAEGRTIAQVASEPPMPGNTSAAHWYKVTKEDYFYNRGRYDIVRFTAFSWDDTSWWLHMDKADVKNSQKKSLPVSATTQILQAVAANVTPTKWAVSMSDFFASIGENISNFKTLDVGANDFTVYYSADYTVNFFWVSEHGADNYFLRAKDQMMEMNYSYAGLVKLTQKDGRVDSLTTGETGARTITYQAPNLGDWSKACQGYQNDTIIEDRVGDVTLTIMGTAHTIRTRGLPPYMDSVA